MKLEKFDYEIGNTKTKKEFVILGVLCLSLIVTVVLYKTFAKFSASAPFNIISARVDSTNRTEITRVNISKTNQDEVYAILYDDKTLSIDGTGYMKDFEGNDLIGEVFDAYLADYATTNNLFTTEEQTFINDHIMIMNSLFDYSARTFLAKNTTNYTAAVTNAFLDTNNQPVQSDIDTANAITAKVASAGFEIEKIEIVGEVKNIGKNAFSLVNATTNSTVRDNIYANVSDTTDYTCNSNAASTFNMVTVEANIEDVGENAMVDLLAQNITIGSEVTEIPDDLFGWYNGGSAVVCNNNTYSQQVSQNGVSLTIPDSVTKIGYGAFYSYNGSDLTLPANIIEIDEYAFANYYGNDFVMPDTVTTLKANAFRDFTGEITFTSCPSDYSFAPLADIYTNNNNNKVQCNN